jgi:hypothetical protein
MGKIPACSLLGWLWFLTKVGSILRLDSTGKFLVLILVWLCLSSQWMGLITALLVIVFTLDGLNNSQVCFL